MAVVSDGYGPSNGDNAPFEGVDRDPPDLVRANASIVGEDPSGAQHILDEDLSRLQLEVNVQTPWGAACGELQRACNPPLETVGIRERTRGRSQAVDRHL